VQLSAIAAFGRGFCHKWPQLAALGAAADAASRRIDRAWSAVRESRSLQHLDELEDARAALSAIEDARDAVNSCYL
jgi:hypothetical protein